MTRGLITGPAVDISDSRNHWNLSLREQADICISRHARF